MKNQLNRDLIEGLSESSKADFVESLNEFVYNLISSAVEDISTQSPFVSLEKCILQPANEICTGAFSQSSTYDYILGIENSQIEFNSQGKKNVWKYIWKEFKASWRIGRKKYKNKKKKQDDVVLYSIDKYKLSDFRHDIVNKTAQYLSGTTMIYESMRNVTFVGADDFGTGIVVNVYIAIYDSKTGVFKLYNEGKNKFTEINFGKRFSNIELKKSECGEMYVNMLKIFNALFSKLTNKIPNQILIESLIYNCPNILFDQNDVYKTFVNIANYLRFASPKDFMSICDTSKSIFEEPLILGSSSQLQFSKIISALDNFKY